MTLTHSSYLNNLHMKKSTDIGDVSNEIIAHLEKAKSKEKEVVVVIKGASVPAAMIHDKAFFELCRLAHTVICCHVSPSQKAEVFYFFPDC